MSQIDGVFMLPGREYNLEKISFCIPCYRSAKTIGIVIEDIKKIVLEREKEFDYEIICVVDGSPDNVFDILSAMAKQDFRIKVINFAKNFGQGNARMASMLYATGDYIVCLDDDGQCPMSEFWNLFKPIENGSDVSIARYPKKKQSVFKNFGSYVNKVMVKTLLDVPKDFTMSNFYVIKRYVVKQIIKYDNPYPYMTGLITRVTSSICHVKMEENERLEGKTGYTFKKLIGLWVNGLTAFSVIPLRISSVAGIICSLLGFIIGAITVIRKLLGADITAGWSSMVSIMLFMGGLIMLMLGMIGEYLGRIYICLNKSPQYVVKDKINISVEEHSFANRVRYDENKKS